MPVDTLLVFQTRAETVKVVRRLLRRVTGMYKADAVDASGAVVAEEQSQLL